MNTLSPEQLAKLAGIDSPTVANAIEAFGLRDPTEGYASHFLHCLFPELPPVVGYAVTCRVDSTTAGKGRPTRIHELYKAVEASPKPAIVVMHDVSSHPERSCHAGDVMSTFFQRLGAIAVVTDGGVRDLAGVRQRAPGFQMFAAGVVVSHGIPIIVEVGNDITVCGMPVRSGDLLHGDANGMVTIPHTIAHLVADEAEKVWAKEAAIIAQVKAEDFTLAALAQKLGWH